MLPEKNEARHQGRATSILMVGTSADTPGGVASVVRIYQERGLFSRWPATYLATHVDGNNGQKLLKAVSAWFVFIRWLFQKREFLLHVHCASRASFWRKSAFILPAAWTGRIVIFHLHGAMFMEFYDKECGQLAKRLVRHILNRCTRIIVLSESWRRAISGITENKEIDVVANPSLPWRCGPTPTTRDAHTLLFLGRLEQRKGVRVLLNALAKLKEKHPDVRLVLAGDGAIEETRQLAESLRLSGHVEILGWVDEARRSELLAAASIFILPSFAEGLPKSIMEAMSAGLPVVTTPVGGIPDAITDGQEGLLVPPGDAEALEHALGRLLEDGELREEMGSRGRAKFDACYDASVAIPTLEALYRELGVTPAGPA